MIGDLLLVLLGLAVVLVGGDLLVRGAVGVAQAMRAPAGLMGLTIVAFGASAPEVVIAGEAALRDAPGLAVGNIIGANIANILLAIGIAACIRPLRACAGGIGSDAIFLLAATAVFIATLALKGRLDAGSSVAFFALFAAYVGAAVLRSPSKAPVGDDRSKAPAPSHDPAAAMMLLICGLIGLPVGAHFLISGSVSFAVDLGVRQEIIGVSIIAAGTSLPEIATMVAAARRGENELAAGGILGSCVFNLLAAGGVVGLLGGAAYPAPTGALEIAALAAATLAIAAIAGLTRAVGRVAGAAMVVAYGAFVVALFAGEFA